MLCFRQKHFFGPYFFVIFSICFSSFHNFHFGQYIFKLVIILVIVIIPLTKNTYRVNGPNY